MTSNQNVPGQGSDRGKQSRPIAHLKGAVHLRWCLVFSTMLMSLLTSSVAAAQGGADKAAAEALFDQARKLMAQGKYAPACEKFEASQELDAGLGTLLHLADCYEKANLLASAWGTFEEAASLARSRGESERAQIAAVRAAALKPQLTRLEVRVQGEPPRGLEVRRNGRIIPPASYNAPIPVDEGTWTVSASAPGHQPFTADLVVGANSSEPYVISIPALLKDSPPPAPTPPPAQATAPPSPPPVPNTIEQSSASGSGQRLLGVLVGGAGVVSVVVSGVFSVLASGSNADSKKECDGTDGAASNQCTSQGVQLRNDALDQASVATITGIIGAVGIGAGTTLYFTAPREYMQPTSGFVAGVRGVW